MRRVIVSAVLAFGLCCSPAATAQLFSPTTRELLEKLRDVLEALATADESIDRALDTFYDGSTEPSEADEKLGQMRDAVDKFGAFVREVPPFDLPAFPPIASRNDASNTHESRRLHLRQVTKSTIEYSEILHDLDRRLEELRHALVDAEELSARIDGYRDTLNKAADELGEDAVDESPIDLLLGATKAELRKRYYEIAAEAAPHSKSLRESVGTLRKKIQDGDDIRTGRLGQLKILREMAIDALTDERKALRDDRSKELDEEVSIGSMFDTLNREKGLISQEASQIKRNEEKIKNEDADIRAHAETEAKKLKDIENATQKENNIRRRLENLNFRCPKNKEHKIFNWPDCKNKEYKGEFLRRSGLSSSDVGDMLTALSDSEKASKEARDKHKEWQSDHKNMKDQRDQNARNLESLRRSHKKRQQDNEREFEKANKLKLDFLVKKYKGRVQAFYAESEADEATLRVLAL